VQRYKKSTAIAQLPIGHLARATPITALSKEHWRNSAAALNSELILTYLNSLAEVFREECENAAPGQFGLLVVVRWEAK